MAKKLHFYRCPVCHSMVDLVNDEGHSLHCCETEMQLMKPKNAEQSDAYHEIVLTHRGTLLYVKIGSKPHPQSEEHCITTIFLVTKNDTLRHDIRKGTPAATVFTDIEHGDVYAYCNVHGLFKTSF
ncbi:MAG: desulfoferrodoxin family protein [Sphaerochaetaceae bacterium]